MIVVYHRVIWDELMTPKTHFVSFYSLIEEVKKGTFVMPKEFGKSITIPMKQSVELSYNSRKTTQKD